jgi:hypothetical protein
MCGRRGQDPIVVKEGAGVTWLFFCAQNQGGLGFVSGSIDLPSFLPLMPRDSNGFDGIAAHPEEVPQYCKRFSDSVSAPQKEAEQRFVS